MKPSFPRSLAALLCAAALFAVPFARAQVGFEIRVNTTGLIGHAAGPFAIDFQLNDGAGIGNGNNTAVVYGFNFGGGAATPASVNTFGNATGDLFSSITLRDTTPFNEFFQLFTPGSFLSFQVSLTNRVSVPTPDLFAFSILDSFGFNIPTNAPGTDALVTIDINGGPPSVHSYGASSLFSPEAGGPPIVLAAPTVFAVPEPSTYGLFAAAALAGLIALRRRR